MLLHFHTPLLLLMTHHEKTQVNANCSPNPNPKGVQSAIVPWNGPIRSAGLFWSYTNFTTAIAQRTKTIKLNHLYLQDIQTDHI